ncbi:MAG: hypothetical protein WCH57_04705 [Verrucomicrobiota bacterium]
MISERISSGAGEAKKLIVPWALSPVNPGGEALVWEANEIERDKAIDSDFVALTWYRSIMSETPLGGISLLRGDNFDALRFDVDEPVFLVPFDARINNYRKMLD